MSKKCTGKIKMFQIEFLETKDLFKIQLNILYVFNDIFVVLENINLYFKNYFLFLV